MTEEESLSYLRRRYAETLYEVGSIKSMLGLHADATLDQVREKITTGKVAQMPARHEPPAWDTKPLTTG
jgi:hypothetical protein